LTMRFFVKKIAIDDPINPNRLKWIVSDRKQFNEFAWAPTLGLIMPFWEVVDWHFHVKYMMVSGEPELSYFGLTGGLAFSF